MENATERRASRRFAMELPLTIRSDDASGPSETHGKTRDVSFRGLYFLADGKYQTGEEIEFVLTLPKEVTLVADVNIRCFGQIVRVEPVNGNHGVAARIERYEFLPAAA